MAEREGFELVYKEAQDANNQNTYKTEFLKNAHIDPQKIGTPCLRLTKIFNRWDKLPEHMKATIETMVDTVSLEL